MDEARRLEATLLREQASWFVLPYHERRKFQGEFVAISGGRVVDHDQEQRAPYLQD